MVTLVSWQCDATVTGAKIGRDRISGIVESWAKKNCRATYLIHKELVG